MEVNPSNLLDFIKHTKVQKGFIEINNQGDFLLKKIIGLFQSDDSERLKEIIDFISNSLLLGTYNDSDTLNDKYKELIEQASKFHDIGICNSLLDFCKLSWEESSKKFKSESTNS